MARTAILYCQHHLGIGHLIRSMAIAAALADANWQVLVVTAGIPPEGIEAPPGVSVRMLEPLRLSSWTRRLRTVSGASPTVGFFARRGAQLGNLLADYRPEWFITEHFPFGRWTFHQELDPILLRLERLRLQGEIQVAASVRDYVGWQPVHSRRLPLLKRYLAKNYDLVFVHADPKWVSFEREFGCCTKFAPRPIYTGYVREYCPNSLWANPAYEWLMHNRKRRNPVAIVSAGAGREGYPLISNTIQAFELEHELKNWQLLVVTGPFIPAFCYDRIVAQIDGRKNVRLVRSVPTLAPLIQRCCLSISQCGYNTAVQLMASDCAAVIVPMRSEAYTESRRAECLKAARGATVLNRAELSIGRLRCAITEALKMRAPSRSLVNLDGAKNTVKALTDHSSRR